MAEDLDEQKKADQKARMAHARAQKGLKTRAATASEIADERQDAQRRFVNQHDKQLKEKHYWITFNRMGESDQVQSVFIGAAGVAYEIRKGERVPLPESAINALKLAVRVGLDHGHPIEVNGRKYLRRIQESEYSYAIDGACTPEEAQEWREGQKRIAGKHADLVPQGQEITDDLVQVGTI